MKFKEYLKTNKIKIKKDNDCFKVNRYYMPYLNTKANKDFNFVTKEDMERIKVMKNYLTSNVEVNSASFLDMLVETPKYKAVADKYPFKKTIAEDLREESPFTFASTIETHKSFDKRFSEFASKSEERE